MAILTALIATAAGYSPLAAPLVILATHELPTKFESGILARSYPDWKEEAEREGYVIETIEPGALVMVRHKNLFNLAAMDELLDGFGAVEASVRSGKNVFRLDDLDASAKQGVRRILANSLVGKEAGPLIESNGTQVMVTSKIRVTVTDGRRTIDFDMPRPGEGPSRDFFNNELKPEDIEIFMGEHKEKYELKPYSDRLVFSFAKADAPSAVRAAAARAFSSRLFELLEEQMMRYMKAENGLFAALIGEEKLPTEGQSLATLNEATQRYMKDVVSRNSAGYGFETDLHLQAFLGDARIKSVSVNAFLSVGMTKDGQRLEVASLMRFTRNPGG